jgi:hypothetical protein
MIDRYTMNAAPPVSHKDILKKLESLTGVAELKNLQFLRIKFDVVCEAGDFKKIADLLKELPRR